VLVVLNLFVKGIGEAGKTAMAHAQARFDRSTRLVEMAPAATRKGKCWPLVYSTI
jgi:hypothetical protein